MKAIVVVDFDNFYPRPMAEYSQPQLESFFCSIISDILGGYSNVDEIIIRLYGGWYQGYGYSKKASELQALLPGISLFPIIINNRRITGSIEMIEQMFGVNYTWLNTYQEKSGIPKLKIDWTKTSGVCNHPQVSCPVKILSNFVKTKRHSCSNDGCSVIHSDVFIKREQKMVDTMMTCDILSFSEEADVATIYIISDDIDLFPSVALSKAKNPSKDIVMIIKNNMMLNQYDSILSEFNAQVKVL